MADRSREEFKIEEKIAAIKETMTRLGFSIKTGSDHTEEGEFALKESHSVGEIEVGSDLLLDTWEGKPMLDTKELQDHHRKSSETWELSVLLSNEREKVAALEKEVEAQRTNSDELAVENNSLKVELKVLEKKLDRSQRDWESLLQKFTALETYAKGLEAQQGKPEPSESRIKDLESQQFTLLLENAEHAQLLRNKDEELSLVKTSLRQLREAMQEKDKVISEMSRARAAANTASDHARGRTNNSSDVLLLKSQISRLNKELQARPSVDECLSKDRQIRLLLEEIKQLKRAKVRARCKSAARVASVSSPRTLKRSKSHDTRRLGLPPIHIARQDTTDQCSTRRVSPSPYKQVTMEIAKLLGVKDTDGLIAEFRRVLKETIDLRAFAAFLTGVVKDSSPPGAFAGTPSLREMQKWIQRLIDEYLLLLKAGHPETLSRLKAMLQVKSSSELLRAVTRQTVDIQSMSEVLKEVRGRLGLDPQVSLDGVRQAVVQRFSRVDLEA